jgi:hypothetical protein
MMDTKLSVRFAVPTVKEQPEIACNSTVRERESNELDACEVQGLM